MRTLTISTSDGSQSLPYGRFLNVCNILPDFGVDAYKTGYSYSPRRSEFVLVDSAFTEESELRAMLDASRVDLSKFRVTIKEGVEFQ